MTTQSMIHSAAPLTNGWLAHLAAQVIAAAQLHGPGRWMMAGAIVAGAWLLGRIGSEILAGLFRLALLAAAVLFAYQLLTV